MLLCDKCMAVVDAAPSEAITGPGDVLALPEVRRIRDALVEHVLVAYLDSRNRPIKVAQVGQGGLRSAVIQPRDILRPAFDIPCAALVLVHNHPSNDPSPSTEDGTVAKQLAEACRVMGLELLDSVVVCANGASSLRELGWL